MQFIHPPARTVPRTLERRRDRRTRRRETADERAKRLETCDEQDEANDRIAKRQETCDEQGEAAGFCASLSGVPFAKGPDSGKHRGPPPSPYQRWTLALLFELAFDRVVLLAVGAGGRAGRLLFGLAVRRLRLRALVGLVERLADLRGRL